MRFQKNYELKWKLSWNKMNRLIDFWKEVMDIMAMIYATLILKGKKRVSDVPAVLRNQVVDILKDVLEVVELPEELL